LSASLSGNLRGSLGGGGLSGSLGGISGGGLGAGGLAGALGGNLGGGIGVGGLSGYPVIDEHLYKYTVMPKIAFRK
jgi:hypothetical protein